ncbi:hypothetical protein BT69DRAFT_1299752 [Atractiella rhizophila]|nr:hypothetical protein BT69DRAFT_1299752 [Atractiella rhizophila]
MPWVAFISCDDNITSFDPTTPNNTNLNIVTLAKRKGATAVVLYSSQNETRIVNPNYLAGFDQTQDSIMVGNGTDNTIPNQGNDGNKCGPNTSLAMIILYAITGCVTFIHPDRYGPRGAGAAGGRDGQTVARALTRAILDTFPVVKFGRTSEDGGTRRDAESSIGEVAEQAKKSVTTMELADLKKADGVNGEMADGTKKGGGKSERASESIEPEVTAVDVHHLDVQHLSSEPEIEVAFTATDAAASEDSKGKRRSMSPPPTTAAVTTTGPATDHRKKLY